MKKHLKILFLLPFLIALSSCLYPYNRTNTIFSGYFEGTNLYNNKEVCSLKVEKITKNEFASSNGVDVILDEIKGGYYKLNFTLKSENNEISSYHFQNLRDSSNGKTEDIIRYKGINNSWFTPGDSKLNENYYYVVEFYLSNIYIHTKLYYQSN